MAGTRGRSVDSARFAMVPRTDVPRSAFDVRHTHKTTFDAGWLVPIFVDEVLPGDSIRVRMSAFARLATPITPVMDNLILESFFFFVPNRIIWENWERFMGEQASPTDTTQFLTPYIDFAFDDISPGDPSGLPDFFGITMNGAVAGTLRVNALPFRAYHRIWNDWFRDQDLQAPVAEGGPGDGPDSGTQVLHRRGKRHDYFTSCRPWPEKPLNMAATHDATGGFVYEPGGDMLLFPGEAGGAPVRGLGIPTGSAEVSYAVKETGGRADTYAEGYQGSLLRIRAHPSSTDMPDIRVLINDIRTANTIQLLMERNARGGSRYSEIVRSHFGVLSPDSRLQRPEYLGGGRTFVTVNPVAQQSASGITGSTTVLGELAGIGTAVAAGHGFSGSFTEHGFILGLVNVRADLTYQQGLERMWSRRTQFDYYWPALANLGEQAVLKKEIFSTGTATAGDNDVFGYQERWAEYRTKPSRISGRFRSTAALPLDIWHFSQEFAARPDLGDIFIRDTPSVDRVLQVAGNDSEQFLLDSLFEIRYVRPLPMFSIPGVGPRL